MKILVSADMEGITGVTTWDQVTPGHPEYERCRRLMTADVNAAVRGAFEGGASEISVADGHWNGSNILVEELDPRAWLISGSPSPLSMMQGIDDGVDGAMFIGYHARHGTAQAVMDHTWSSTCVHHLWLNDQLAGEYTLNAALAGQYGVPIVLASGDRAACDQISLLITSLETAVVKTASGRHSADCLPPEVSHPQIQAKARQAVERLTRNEFPAPFVLPKPIRLRIEFQTSDMADRASLWPRSRRDGLQLALTADDMLEAFQAFRGTVNLAYPR
jgi:D-amino peptidase